MYDFILLVFCFFLSSGRIRWGMQGAVPWFSNTTYTELWLCPFHVTQVLGCEHMVHKTSVHKTSVLRCSLASCVTPCISFPFFLPMLFYLSSSLFRLQIPGTEGAMLQRICYHGLSGLTEWILQTFYMAI